MEGENEGKIAWRLRAGSVASPGRGRLQGEGRRPHPGKAGLACMALCLCVGDRG